MSIKEYGWSAFFSDAFAALEVEGLAPARVTRAAAQIFRVRSDDYHGQATMAGRLRHDAATHAELPTVGDWVGIKVPGTGDARIEVLLPRRSALSRNVAGRRTTEQVVAANVDLVIVVMGLDGDFNLRRLERYVTAIWESGARPAILLNKADLCEDIETRRKEVEAVAQGAPLIIASCKLGEGVELLRAELSAGETAVLVGSSGAGKSTLINLLLGEAVQPTREVRSDDDRGRHTTTHRELFRLPGGALLIDSPGIRELQLWGGEQSLSQAFDDVEELASRCRFRDCGHTAEAGCAVLEAVKQGSLEVERLESYRVLQKELRYLETRQSETAQRAQKQKWRGIHREYRRFTKKKKK